MPPKRRRIDPGVKQGVGRQYVIDTFSDMPDGGRLLNGHVMYIYLDNCSSLAKTGAVVMSLNPKFMSIKYLIRRLVTRTLGKFRQLTDPKQLDIFKGICGQLFGVTRASHDGTTASTSADSLTRADPLIRADLTPGVDPPLTVAPSTSTYAPSISVLSGTTSSDPSTSLHPSTAANTPTSTRLHTSAPVIVAASAGKCSRCAVLRDRLSKSLQVRKRMIESHRSKIATMKAKLSQSRTVKVLNQKLKRKEQQIKILKEGKRTRPAEMGQLENAYRLLKNTKRKLKRLQHSSKAVPSSVESTDS